MTTQQILAAAATCFRFSKLSSKNQQSHSKTEDPTDPERLAARLRQAFHAKIARTGRVETWQAISASSRISPSAISQVLAGTRKLTIAEAWRIARELECAAGWLAFREGRMEREEVPFRPVSGVPFDTGRPADEAMAEDVARRQREREADRQDQAASARRGPGPQKGARPNKGRRPR